jgi:hypothetical protein
MSKKYYFDLPYTKKYETIWYGYLEFDKIKDYDISNNISKLNEVITEITDISFYINIEDNKIYLSIDNDGNYYGSSRFENDIRNIITHIEQYLSKNDLNIIFLSGEFTAIEYKPDGNQYKYKITNNLTEHKIDIKKRVLNWNIIKPKS